MTTAEQTIKAAMGVAKDLAEGRIDPPGQLEQLISECRALLGTVVGEGTVDADDHDGVATPGVVEQGAQAGPLLTCGRAGQHIGIDAAEVDTDSGQRVILPIEGLMPGRYAGLAKQRAGRRSGFGGRHWSVPLNSPCAVVSIRNNFRDS
jgi:hypothetical protein